MPIVTSFPVVSEPITASPRLSKRDYITRITILSRVFPVACAVLMVLFVLCRYVLEGYNALSWLALDNNSHDRLSCLPAHVQVLMKLYHLTAALV